MLALLCAGIVIAMYLTGFYRDGQFVTYIHDGMDSNIALYKMMADGHYFFLSNNTTVPNMMGGMPRSIFASELNVVSMLFAFFKPEHALIINQTLVNLVAFVGMLLLLRVHVLSAPISNGSVLNKHVNDAIIILLALAFSLLPYWSLGGVSVAMQPLVLYAFLTLQQSKQSVWTWLIFLLYPFYSSLILAGMFVLFALGLVWLVDAYRHKKLNLKMLAALLLMSALYLIAEYRLLASFIDPQFVSNREDFETAYLHTSDALAKSIQLFAHGQYHAYPLNGPYLLPSIAVLALFVLVRQTKLLIGLSVLAVLALLFGDLAPSYGFWYLLPITALFVYKRQYLISALLISVYCIVLFAGFEDSLAVKPLKDAWPILEQISFDRFYFLLPLLWAILFALVINYALHKKPQLALFVIPVLLLQAVYAFGEQNAHTHRKPALFDDFYSEQTYTEIEQYIGLPQDSYRVMSIGLHPSAALYNGFYTVDGYIAYYPLENKQQFREIIAPELDKDDKLKHAFDSLSGRRCRLMSRNRNLSLNLDAFKKMEGKFIFSAYPIQINDGKETQLLRKFQRADQRNFIFLYRVL